ncbi:MAG: sulfite exporter TauE/SafE family protein [Candidatus Aminicenantes bacterium]|nr:sulfite exporter TauE/SafE family protein [Candidatus Aminicenantes bacterium]MDH5715979.1 sulfite exporter TauE/SafE family protein [Candidatus Aminicenantes bacterium]
MVDLNIIVFIIVGFIAQMIDGALGMAYGVSSTSFLLSIGVPPAAASASVHTAEVFTTFVSGVSHLKFGNVDKKIFRKLLIPGIIGGVLGAYVLTAVPGDKIKPFIGIYLLIMGLMILRKAFKVIKERRVETKLLPLGAAGGFFDAIGGGGWGPIVTSTLMARGHSPRFSIGSVNLAEFFVTVAEAATFFTILGLVHWQVIVGLLIGGVIAAPLAAYICKRLPSRALMIIVGILITALSVRTIYLALF